MSFKNEQQATINQFCASAAVPQQAKSIVMQINSDDDTKKDGRYFNSNGNLELGAAIQTIAIVTGAVVEANEARAQKFFKTYTDIIIGSVAEEDRPAVQEQIDGSRQYMGMALTN